MSYKINSPPVSGHFFTKQETIFDHVAWGFEIKIDKGNFVCITSYKCVVIVAIKSESGQFLNTGTSHSIVFTIKRIHHWCSVGTGKSQPEGPPFQWETRRWTRGLGFSGSTVHQ